MRHSTKLVSDRKLLLVDDDEAFCAALGRALERRGFAVAVAHNPRAARRRMDESAGAPFQFAVVDLVLHGESGLPLIQELTRLYPGIRVVMVTGHSSIASAVAAIKAGAVHYLVKPVDAEQITWAFDQNAGDKNVPVEAIGTTLKMLEWERIQEVIIACAGNVSKAAERMGLHRRTLQRKLRRGR